MRSCREKVRQEQESLCELEASLVYIVRLFQKHKRAKRIYYGASEKAQRAKTVAEKEDSGFIKLLMATFCSFLTSF